MIVDLVKKASLLEIGESLYAQALSLADANDKVKGIKKLAQGLPSEVDYTLIPYTKKDELGEWWVCIAKVLRPRAMFVKKPTGEIIRDETVSISKEFERMVSLALRDGRPFEEIEALATNDFEKKYIQNIGRGRYPNG